MMVNYRDKISLASRAERQVVERLETTISQPGQSLDCHDEYQVQRGSVQRGLKFSRRMDLYLFVINDSFFLKTSSNHLSSDE